MIRTAARLFVPALLTLAGLSGAEAQAVETYIVIEPVHWQADAPCDPALRLDLDALPGGTVRDRAAEQASNERIFTAKSGARIVITLPEVRDYDVFGADYAAVYTDMMERQPLHRFATPVRNGTNVMVAQIETRVALSSSMVSDPASGSADFIVPADELEIRMNPSISLARWTRYDDAAPDQQALWDRSRCESIHHELGHLLITAQMFEAQLDAPLALRSSDSDALSAQLSAWFNATMDESRVRQNRYHTLIESMGPEVARARPYLELDFPWLDGNDGS